MAKRFTPSKLGALSEEFEQPQDFDKVHETIDCKFRLHYVAEFGQILYLVGSDPAMGEWRHQSAVLMHWQPGDFWITDVTISKEIPSEYKYIVKADNGTVIRWEEGPNRILSVPNYDNATLKIYDHWGSR